MAIFAKKESLVTKQQEYYSDFLADFSKHPVKKDLVRTVNEEAVKSSIRNLIATNRGDRLFNNTIGSDIKSMLFEHATPGHERVLEELIRTTIENYEPRAKLIDVVVSSEEDNHFMSATIVFRIINNEEPTTLELLLNRIR